MELMGVISGLEALKYPCEVVITTDSKYVYDGKGTTGLNRTRSRRLIPIYGKDSLGF